MGDFRRVQGDDVVYRGHARGGVSYKAPISISTEPGFLPLLTAMPVPGFLSSIADKAQNALNNSPLSQHIPSSMTGRPASISGDSAASSGYKNYTLEQIQHQFRTLQQTYS